MLILVELVESYGNYTPVKIAQKGKNGGCDYSLFMYGGADIRWL